jgi:hypothetical protein
MIVVEAVLLIVGIVAKISPPWPAVSMLAAAGPMGRLPGAIGNRRG